MADFRKWFMVIAVVLLAAATASAQQNYTMPCSMTGNTEMIRASGITEQIGEVDLACNSTSLTPLGSAVTAQFTLQVNGTITNSTGSGLKTMAGAAVQYDLAPFAIPYTVQGVVATAGIMQFPNVTLPTGTTFTIRFFNVRVAATTLVNPPSSPAGLPEVIAGVSANAYNAPGTLGGWSVTFNQSVSSVVVGQVIQPMDFSVTDCVGGSGPTNIPLQECISYPLRSFDNVGSQAAPVWGVTFKEHAPLAVGSFKNIVKEDGTTIPALGQPTISGVQICDTAHNATGDLAVIGDPPPVIPACPNQPAWVSNGTRLVVQFAVGTATDTRLVNKIHIWVSQNNTASASGATATLATISSPVGSGLDDYSTGPRVGCGSGGGRWVELPDGPVETAAWEVTSSNVAAIDDLTFAWAITYEEGSLPSLGTGAYPQIGIQGALGPVDLKTPAPLPLSKGAPVVRFAPGWTPANVPVTIEHCVTNLLFPYVTNVVGFDTGIAIANTSLDSKWNLTDPPTDPKDARWGTADTGPLPYNTTPQSGPCNLYLFGSASAVSMTTAASPVQAIASAVTSPVAAGQIFADTLSSIFGLNTAAQKMSGYVIARCQFQFGHGYAYLVNPAGAPQGYLALIIPDRNIYNAGPDSTTGFTITPVRIAQPFSNALDDEQGEMLVE